MHAFERTHGRLACEGVDLEKLAAEHGTPLYVYSAGTVADHFRRLDAALAPLDHLICYAVKANSTGALLATLAGKASKEYGAIGYHECVADDVKPGKWTSFPQAVKLKKGEVVVFSYIVYKSRRERDRIMKQFMNHPRMQKYSDPKKMPFDGKRMFWGGFKSMVKM